MQLIIKEQNKSVKKSFLLLFRANITETEVNSVFVGGTIFSCRCIHIWGFMNICGSKCVTEPK